MNNQVKSELHNITRELNTLNNHRFVRLYNSVPKMLWFQFLRGVFFGLGSVVGATIVVSVLISFLSQVEFIPIVGEWAKELMVEIKRVQQ